MLRKLVIAGSALAAAGLVLLTAQVVSAHSRPIRFDPPPGAILSSSPAKIDGWFTADLRRDPSWNYIQVRDPQGNRVDEGEPILSSDRRQMSVNLRPGLPNGRYLVSWRTWDEADGAIFGDCYTFFVGHAAADAAFNDKARLDGGRDCQRIDVAARDGTPVAGGTPQAAAGASPAAVDDHSDAGGELTAESGGDEDGGGVPVWGLVLGVVLGVVVGGLGGRLVASKP